MRLSARPVVAGLIVVLSLVLGTGSLARAEGPETTSLSIKAPAAARADSRPTVSGALVDAGGKPVPAAVITVRWRKVGGDWRWSTTATTDAKGRWSAKIKIGHNTEFRASYDGTVEKAPSTSAVVGTEAQQWATIGTVSPSRPAIGQLVTISGTVSKAVRGRTLSLQRRLSGSWTTVATTKASATGSYATTIRVQDGSSLALRVRSSAGDATAGRATSLSRTVYVAVTATLSTGGTLAARRVLSSPNGLYTATMGTDGNLVVRHGRTITWRSGTTGKGNAVRISSTGNLTIGTTTKTRWSSDTTGGVARLVLQNDGNLVLWSKARTLWSSARGKGVQVAPALCWSTSFDCVSWTGYNPNVSYWRMYSGHNCTNYAAYRMIMKGIKNPPWGYPGGSAWQWREGAKKSKITVDKTPAVGAIMQWGRNTNGGGSSGHVVYVEQVTRTAVIISEDSWSSHASVRVINRSSNAFADARFIHLADGA